MDIVLAVKMNCQSNDRWLLEKGQHATHRPFPIYIKKIDIPVIPGNIQSPSYSEKSSTKIIF